MRELIGLITTLNVADVVDILAVAALFYFIFSLLRGTRSSVALRGMITLLFVSFFIYFIARVANLSAVEMIFQNIWIVVVLVFIFVFQNEFKKALTDVGQLRIFRALFTPSGAYIDELVRAVQVMSTRHVGALIALERRNSLRPYIETGIAVDAVISTELVRTIFTPYSPTHDGAVIVSGDRMVAAHCILPLAEGVDLAKDLGTRHRAAIGLSEETDALVIVVSEETGTISLAVGGTLHRPLKPEEIKRRLEEELDLAETKSEEEDVESVD